jgi:hypothetical protein
MNLKNVLLIGGIAVVVLVVLGCIGGGSPGHFGTGFYGGFDSEGKWLR